MIRMRVIAASAAALGCWAAGTASGKPLEDPLTYTGMCDASAAAPLGTSLFVAASDEDNILRVYHRNQAGPHEFCDPERSHAPGVGWHSHVDRRLHELGSVGGRLAVYTGTSSLSC
jgi:hypothetical protein